MKLIFFRLHVRGVFNLQTALDDWIGRKKSVLKSIKEFKLVKICHSSV